MATLTPVMIAMATIASLRKSCPALSLFSHDFTTEPLRLGQQAIAHIRKVPTASQYDAVEGYAAGANDTKDLLVDVPFKMEGHVHVTLRMKHLHALANQKNKLSEHIADSTTALGDQITRYVLSKVNSAAFSNAVTYSTANSDYDMLTDVRAKLNARGVLRPRFGIVNSDVATTLDGDSRLTNRADQRSQELGENPYVTFTNKAGFGTIVEDPNLGTGTDSTTIAITGDSATGVITAASAHGYVKGMRVQIAGLTGGTGLTAGYYHVADVPTTTTFKLSSTNGGAAVTFSSDLTAGTIKKAENLTGFFGHRNAIAIKTGLPDDPYQLAKSLGLSSDNAYPITDPESGLSMLVYEWWDPKMKDLFVTLTLLYGATAGALCDEQKLVMEPSVQLLRSE